MDRRAEEPAFAAPRTPVVYDWAAGALRIGPYERRVDDPSSADEVYGAYLSLLYAARAARPGERLALRAADLEALLLLVGDDPSTIELRLVELMGCTPEEAGRLAGVLLRHRRMTATLGVAAGLSLAGVGLASQLPDAPSRTPQAIASAPAPQAAMVGPVATAPVVAAAAPADPAPVAPDSGAVLRPAFVGPVVQAPAPAPVPVPVEVPVEPVREAPDAAPVVPPVVAEEPADTLALPSFPEPLMDAPPPVEPEPGSDLGTPAVLEPGSQEIGGVVEHGTGHGLPDSAEVDGLVPLPDPFAPGADLPVSDTATAVIG